MLKDEEIPVAQWVLWSTVGLVEGLRYVLETRLRDRLLGTIKIEDPLITFQWNPANRVHAPSCLSKLRESLRDSDSGESRTLGV